MANIFRSKEVYKRIPGVPSDQNPLRVVRGVYVTGPYRAPYYIDTCTHVKSITTTKATVVNYTQASSDSTDHVVNLLNVDASTDPIPITFYTRAESQLQSDHVVNLLNVDASTDQIDILAYTKINQDLASDHVVNLMGIDTSADTPNITFYRTEIFKTNPEPIVRVKELTTTKATIANG